MLAVLPLIAFEVAIASFAIIRIRGTDAEPPLVATVRIVAIEAPPHPE